MLESSMTNQHFVLILLFSLRVCSIVGLVAFIAASETEKEKEQTKREGSPEPKLVIFSSLECSMYETLSMRHQTESLEFVETIGGRDRPAVPMCPLVKATLVDTEIHGEAPSVGRYPRPYSRGDLLNSSTQQSLALWPETA